MNNNDHIPTDEILNDIADTEMEIFDYERKIPALRTLNDRMSHFKADYMVNEIRERKQFIVKLRAILMERKYSPNGSAL